MSYGLKNTMYLLCVYVCIYIHVHPYYARCIYMYYNILVVTGRNILIMHGIAHFLNLTLEHVNFVHIPCH